MGEFIFLLLEEETAAELARFPVVNGLPPIDEKVGVDMFGGWWSRPSPSVKLRLTSVLPRFFTGGISLSVSSPISAL